MGPRPGFPRYSSRGCWFCLVFPGFVVVSHVAVLVFSSCSISVPSKDVLQRFFTFQQPGSWREIKTPRFPREETLEAHIGFVWEMTCGCFCISAQCVVRLWIHVQASVPEVSQIDMALSVGSGSCVFVGKSDPFCAPQACTDCSRWQPLKQPCPSNTLLIDVVFLHETGAWRSLIIEV